MGSYLVAIASKVPGSYEIKLLSLRYENLQENAYIDRPFALLMAFLIWSFCPHAVHEIIHLSLVISTMKGPESRLRKPLVRLNSNCWIIKAASFCCAGSSSFNSAVSPPSRALGNITRGSHRQRRPCSCCIANAAEIWICSQQSMGAYFYVSSLGGRWLKWWWVLHSDGRNRALRPVTCR